jgi:hypothetical protein
MEILSWLRNLVGYSLGQSPPCPDKGRQKGIQSDVGKTKEEGEALTSTLPQEMLVQIFENLAADALKQPWKKEALYPLLQCAQVCWQWNAVAEEYCSKIFEKAIGTRNKPEGMTWAQSLGVLHNWREQTKKVTLQAVSQLRKEEFQSVDCHLPLDNPAMTFDKVEVNAIRILLNSKYLLALKGTDKGQASAQRLWYQKIENSERHIFVSKDQQLIATQHYETTTNKKGTSNLVCRFDVRFLQTGQLLGSVKVLCPQGKKIYNETNIQFDFTKFMSQRKDQVEIYSYLP